MAGPRSSYGARDFALAELRNFRVHIYATQAQLDAAASTAEARLAYCTETTRFYFGRSGVWVGLNFPVSWGDPVAGVGDLPDPADTFNGDIRVVLNDGAGVGPTLYAFRASDSTWNKISDPRIVYIDGTRDFTAFPKVEAAAGAPATARALTTKDYTDATAVAAAAAAIAAHIGGDPHPQYMLDSDVTSAINASMSAHLAALDPHTQYALKTYADASSAAAASSSMSAHLLAADPHSQYLLDTVFNAHAADNTAHGNALGALATHAGDAGDPHVAAGYQKAAQVTSTVNAAVNAAIAAHNTDPSAHPGLVTGGGGGSSVSETLLAIARVVIGGVNGTPLKAVTNLHGAYEPIALPADEPSVMSIQPSSTTTETVTGAAMDATGLNMTSSTANFQPGDIISMTSALNNKRFRVTGKNSAKIFLEPAPTVEPAIGTIGVQRWAADGIICVGGVFYPDRTISRAGIVITQLVKDNGYSSGRIYYSTEFGDADRFTGGDQITIAGATDPANNGTYTIASVFSNLGYVDVTAVLGGANQPGAGGTATFSHTGSTNSFPTGLTAPVDIYADTGAAHKYSTTLGHFRLGQLIDDERFIMRIEPVGRLKAAISANTTETARHLKKRYNVDSTGGAFTLTLYATPVEGDKVVVTDYGAALETNNVTINGNGQNILGAATLVLDTNRMSIELTYTDGEWKAL